MTTTAPAWPRATGRALAALLVVVAALGLGSLELGLLRLPERPTTAPATAHQLDAPGRHDRPILSGRVSPGPTTISTTRSSSNRVPWVPLAAAAVALAALARTGRLARLRRPAWRPGTPLGGPSLRGPPPLLLTLR